MDLLKNSGLWGLGNRELEMGNEELGTGMMDGGCGRVWMGKELLSLSLRNFASPSKYMGNGKG